MGFSLSIVLVITRMGIGLPLFCLIITKLSSNMLYLLIPNMGSGFSLSLSLSLSVWLWFVFCYYVWLYVVVIFLVMILGEKDELYVELWHACAGPLVYIPRAGEKVFYFPQGHMEQVPFLFVSFFSSIVLLFYQLPCLISLNSVLFPELNLFESWL